MYVDVWRTISAYDSIYIDRTREDTARKALNLVRPQLRALERAVAVGAGAAQRGARWSERSGGLNVAWPLRAPPTTSPRSRTTCQCTWNHKR